MSQYLTSCDFQSNFSAHFSSLNPSKQELLEMYKKGLLINLGSIISCLNNSLSVIFFTTLGPMERYATPLVFNRYFLLPYNSQAEISISMDGGDFKRSINSKAKSFFLSQLMALRQVEHE